jgi:hypothetical protein
MLDVLNPTDSSIENSWTLSPIAAAFSEFFTEPLLQDRPGGKSAPQPIVIYHF